MKSDNGYFFEIKFINSTKFQIPRQYPMVITLNDGSTITLKTMDDKGKTVTERPANFSASALYGINVIDLKKLKEQGAKSINLSTREGKVDLPLKKKQGQLLAGLAGCIQ
ncbi:MAG: hypothetical protein SFW35_00955 [Chitinophagales bacterium]|nr:hypothetical protein [Chitinophagales bacterium]